MNGFEQQSQDEIVDRMRQAMLAAKFGQVRDNAPTAPPPVLTQDQTATATGAPATPIHAIQQVGQQMADAGPQQYQPQISLAHAVKSEQPSTKDVDAAQAALNAHDHPSKFVRFGIPAIMGLAAIANSRQWNAKSLGQEETGAIERMRDQNEARRQSLVNQLTGAQGRQEQEYEADQRNRQQDLITAANNQNRNLMAQIAAGSRRDVAQTAADSRETVAQTAGQSRESVAKTAADAHIAASRYAADEAMDRLIYGQNRQDQRQQRGIAAGFQRQEQGYENTLNKPTADEDRRADLAKAGIGYAEMLKDIYTRRPDLIGPISGRVTGLRNAAGTSDPDVATLKYLKEQLGIVQMGAHSLRSAQAIAPIADSLVNSFNNEPEAAIAVVNKAQEGLKMFTGEQIRPTVNQPKGATPKASAAKPKPSAAAPATQVNEMMWDSKLKKAVPIAH